MRHDDPAFDEANRKITIAAAADAAAALADAWARLTPEERAELVQETFDRR